MNLYTAQYRYKGSTRMDITAATKNRFGWVFAPTWDIVRMFKADPTNLRVHKTYTEEYLRQMRASYKANREIWDTVLSFKEITIVCYCTTAFCHRHLLADILTKLGAVNHGERPIINKTKEQPIDLLSNTFTE